MTRSTLASVLVLLVTVILCLGVGELAFRVIDGYHINRMALVPLRMQNAGPVDVSDAYAKHLSLQPAFKRAWYATDPPSYTLPNDYPLPPEWKRAVADYKPAPGERAFIKNELKFLYNYNWLIEACKTGRQTNVIKHYRENPGFVYAFKSPDSSDAPQYRLVPHGWNNGEDSYNNFGFRGPDITPRKSSRTIRIAFIGASTTAQGWPFTYPEYAVHFLQLWADSQHFNVTFDMINAGRPGLDSLGISKIMRFEVAPLRPDLVVYDPGANDFDMTAYVKSDAAALTQLRTRADSLPLQNYSALLDRIYQLAFRAKTEPYKPAHSLSFDFAQRVPNLSQSNLPFRLNAQIADAADISRDVKDVKGQLFVTSFIALPRPGLRLDPETDRQIIAFLDQQYWPLTYAELRQGFDFQNNAYRELAKADDYDFLDVSKYFPEDPSLFSDAFHFRTQSGERLEGWIVAQLLTPYLRDAIQRRQLPKGPYVPSPSALAWVHARPIRFSLACLPP